MANFVNKIKLSITTHKIISIIGLLVVLFVGHLVYAKITSTTGDTRYLTTKVTKGTIVSSVTGTGQVSSFNEVDIKAKASGDAVYVGVSNGQKVRAGAIIAELDSTDAKKSVRDAEVNLQSAQISLNKLKIQNSTDNMNADLTKAYDDGFSTVSNAFLDLPGIMTGLDAMFFKSDPATGQINVNWYENQVASADRDKAYILQQNFVNSYKAALAAYNKDFESYKSISRNSASTDIENIILETYNTTTLISDTIKNGNNYIDFVNDSMLNNNFNIPAIIAVHRATLSTDTSKTNTALVNLLSSKTDIKNNKDAFPNSDLDLQSSELAVEQRQNALQDAKDALSDYVIRAPFAGTISTVNIKKSDPVGSGTTVATLITQTQIAEISLNEVDVAKIKLGQKATLTFDAIPDLTITGNVADIDSVGTVSQGVVTYNVKINFDTQDVRVKSAMSVSAAIITNSKQNILVVPNSAVKSQNGTSYVQMFSTPLPAPTDGLLGSISKIPPNNQPIEVGISNDTLTEVTSGLNEGDEVVSRTILPSAAKSAAAPSLFGSGAPATRGGTPGGIRATAPGR